MISTLGIVTQVYIFNGKYTVSSHMRWNPTILIFRSIIEG